MEGFAARKLQLIKSPGQPGWCWWEVLMGGGSTLTACWGGRRAGEKIFPRSLTGSKNLCH